MQHEMSIAPCLQLATKISYWCDAAVIVSTDECWRMSNNLIHWKFMSIVQRITAYKCSTLGSRVIRRGRAKRRQMQSTTTCVFVSPTRFYCTVFKDTFDMSRLPASIWWLWIEQHVAAGCQVTRRSSMPFNYFHFVMGACISLHIRIIRSNLRCY